MNVITIAGNTGKAAELRHTQKGEPVLGFSLADSRKLPNGEKVTTWFECSIWGARAEKLLPYIGKGVPVTVVGTFSPREYTDKNGTQRISYDVRVQEIALQGKQDEEKPAAPRHDKAQAWKAGAQQFDDFADDDVPF